MYLYHRSNFAGLIRYKVLKLIHNEIELIVAEVGVNHMSILAMHSRNFISTLVYNKSPTSRNINFNFGLKFSNEFLT
jgi:hypothetical protein